MLSLASASLAADDGLALMPPRAWRSWNQFNGAVTQADVERALPRPSPTAAASSTASPPPRPDLGYTDAGIDDGWQECGHYGPHQYRYHDANGAPVVAETGFPSLSNLTALAWSLGLTASWYANACGCTARRTQIAAPTTATRPSALCRT